MKLIITSDWHYCEHPNTPNLKENIKSAIDTIFQYANDNVIKHILFAGDFINKNNSTSLSIQQDIHYMLNDYLSKNPNITIIGIDGNHDQGEISTLENRPSCWGNILHATHTNYTSINFATYQLNSTTKVIGIPYLKYKEDFQQALKNATIIARNDCDFDYLLLIHQTPKYEGIKFNYDTDPSVDDYMCFDKVYCGHIHKRVDITHNFSLIGTSLQLSYSDGGKDVSNGFLVYDTETKTHEFINLDYPKFVTVDSIETNSNDYQRLSKKIKVTLSKLNKGKFTSENKETDIIKTYAQLKDLDNNTKEIGLQIFSKIKP